jgi:hypothetical protein
LLLVPFDTIVRDAPHAGERLIHRIVAIGIHNDADFMTGSAYQPPGRCSVMATSANLDLRSLNPFEAQALASSGRSIRAIPRKPPGAIAASS